jgi:hypothetical protein
MSRLATRRLIDAAATLDPADRAFLNLWVNRGLDDERLMELTGMSRAALEKRRGKIVARLGAELGLPEQDIRGALEQISPGDEEVTTPRTGGVTDAPSGTNGADPAAAREDPAEAPETAVSATVAPETAASETAAVTPQATAIQPDRLTDRPAASDHTALPEQVTGPEGGPSPPSGRRRGRWLGLAVLLAIVVAAVIAVLAGGGASPQTSHRAASTAITPTTATQTPTVATPTHPTAGPVPAPLLGLPGGLAHASGAIKLSGPVKHLSLNLTVRGLPAPHAGHYEVWLYNSVLDSRPLARLRTGRHHLVIRLPARARRYRWIDISFQPAGVINHSGESELRASNPAHAPMARLRRRSARTRHPLRQASKVAAAHPAHTHKTKPRPTTKGHGRRAHRLKRSAKGSKKSRTS